jgi:hypothetical protein
MEIDDFWLIKVGENTGDTIIDDPSGAKSL